MFKNNNPSTLFILFITVAIVFYVDFTAGLAYIAVLSLGVAAIKTLQTVDCYLCQKLRKALTKKPK